jgi:hypothetical protein
MRRDIIRLGLLLAVLVLLVHGFGFTEDQKSEPANTDTGLLEQKSKPVTSATPAEPKEVPAVQSSADPESGEQINWQVISSGGTDGSSTNYMLAGTVGQTAVGAGTSTNFGLSHGFWQEYASGDCCGAYTGGQTGNTNCDTDGKRNLADITRLIDRVYVSQTPLCCEPNGNTNGDPGGVINLADITRLIDFVYVSHAETAPC